MLTTINVSEKLDSPDLKGFYVIPHFDVEAVLEKALGRRFSPEEIFFHYGVADSALNIFEKHSELSVFDDRNFVVFMTEIRVVDQPFEGGWRWHKWGEYIGEHTPQHEYLAYEKGIDSVFVYRIVWLK